MTTRRPVVGQRGTMRSRDVLTTSVQALRARAVRSALTMLGIVIATAAVIAVTTVIEGLGRAVTDHLEGVGSGWIMIVPYKDDHKTGARESTLDSADVDAIRQRVVGIEGVSPLFRVAGKVTAGAEHHATSLVGVNEDFTRVNRQAIAQGRFFTRAEATRRGRVAVVGATIVRELGLGDHPVGARILVGRTPMTIVGVLSEQGQFLGRDSDDQVFVPHSTLRRMRGAAAVRDMQILVQAGDTAKVESVAAEIDGVVRARHRLGSDDDGFEIILQDEILATTRRIMTGITVVTIPIVAIALLVGGIGVMNVMFMSVTERTAEIGLRKSIGARDHQILAQFLLEAVILSFVGGAIGVALGYAMGALVFLVLPEGFGHAIVPVWAVAVALATTSLVGVVFGIHPALRAARMDPIGALRHE